MIPFSRSVPFFGFSTFFSNDFTQDDVRYIKNSELIDMRYLKDRELIDARYRKECELINVRYQKDSELIDAMYRNDLDSESDEQTMDEFQTTDEFQFYLFTNPKIFQLSK